MSLFKQCDYNMFAVGFHLSTVIKLWRLKSRGLNIEVESTGARGSTSGKCWHSALVGYPELEGPLIPNATVMGIYERDPGGWQRVDSLWIWGSWLLAWEMLCRLEQDALHKKRLWTKWSRIYGWFNLFFPPLLCRMQEESPQRAVNCI